MKKLLVLAMVLGLVATANAGLCTLTGGTQMVVGATETISVMSANATSQNLNLEIDDTAAGALAQLGVYTLGDFVYTGGTPGAEGMTVLAASGNLAQARGPVSTGYAGFYAMTGAGSAGGFPTSGAWFTVNYTAGKVGTEYITLYDGDSLAEIGQLVIHQTPEPFTMGLLGLGGLFLRRRSK